MTQRIPYDSIESKFAIALQVVQARLRPQIPETVPQQFRPLIEALWDQNPTSRPSLVQVSKDFHNLVTDQFLDILGPPNPDESVQQNEFLNGAVFIMCVENAAALWQEFPEKMESALIMFNSSITKLVVEHNGHCLHKQGDEQIIVFLDQKSAVQFAINIQELSNMLPWPTEFLAFLEQTDSTGLYRGFLPKIGVCEGRVSPAACAEFFSGNTCDLDASALETASFLCQQADGGQVLVTRILYEMMMKSPPLRASVTSRLSDIKGSRFAVGGSHDIYELYPSSLGLRLMQSKRQKPTIIHTTIEEELKENEEIALPNAAHLEGEWEHSSGTKAVNSSSKTACKTVKSHNNERSVGFLLQAGHAMKFDFELDMTHLVLSQEKLGVGSYGTVYLGSYKGEMVAVKRMLHQTTEERFYLAFLSEVIIMSKLKHPNIIRLVGACTRVPNLAIVTEYVEMGTLLSLLSNRKEKISFHTKKRIIEGVARGMSYLHRMKPPILHRDLKSANILLDTMMEAKICDFGFTRTKAFNQMMTRCGTVAYEAPEILEGKNYCEKVDVFSFSIVLWEILTRELPYTNMDSIQIANYVTSGRRPKIPQNAPKILVSLMVKCWNQDPLQRPDFASFSDLNEYEMQFIRSHS